nr:hypothetical protein [Candidatus Brachybacter algidus]
MYCLQGIKLAVVEAKSDELEVVKASRQAKQYAKKLQLETTYSTNGKEIYSICMKTGEEGLVTDFLNSETTGVKLLRIKTIGEKIFRHSV